MKEILKQGNFLAIGNNKFLLEKIINYEVVSYPSKKTIDVIICMSEHHWRICFDELEQNYDDEVKNIVDKLDKIIIGYNLNK